MAERTDLTSAPSSFRQGQGQGQDVVSGAERSAEEIRQDIAARRESITDTVDRLSDRFQQTFDWRAYVSDYPLAALGVAAGLGFLAARMIKPRPTAGRRIKDAIAHGIEDLTGHFQHQLGSVTSQRSGPGLSGTVKAALTGLVTKAATDYLQNRFVGRHTSNYESENRQEWGL